MKNVITNAADITVLRLIDNTQKTGGGPASVGATVVMASKGPVGKVVQVTDSNWQQIFGKPLNKKASGMEGLRHLAEAVKECNYVNVVRVVAADARFPSLSIKTADGTVTAAGHAYGTALSLGSGVCLQVWPIDGDPSTKRSFEIKDIVTDKSAWVTATVYAANDVVTVTGGRLICVLGHTAGATAPTMAVPGVNWKAYDGKFDSRVTINFYDKDTENVDYLLESYVVGFDPSDKDDMGRPAYIETVLEQNSERFRANWDEGVTLATARTGLKAFAKTAFTGGLNGADPVTAEWKAAWDLFRNETYLAHLMFAAGNTDTDVIANCLDIASKRHVSFFFDVSPLLPAAQALIWIKGLGQDQRQGAAYYCPFEANDSFYGGKAVWGVSGEAVAACARGDQNYTGSTPGIHYAPAGSTRARLTRTGIKPLFPEQSLNRDDFYDARINPVTASDSGGATIDDCLSIHYKQDYSRFIWVNRIANYIDHRFVEGAAYMKFEPDGLTRNGLTKLTKQILDELVTSGALVTPRDITAGTTPYVLKVEQVEIDLWLVTWDFCPTGAARRIAGQPRLIK